ncbi:ficolin-1-like [Mytilus trossulus]|uniref:ficolin-1-like n=1 Tax=Mytilus trossulus TaxID=6551 RepID=UPI00300446C6
MQFIFSKQVKNLFIGFLVEELVWEKAMLQKLYTKWLLNSTVNKLGKISLPTKHLEDVRLDRNITNSDIACFCETRFHNRDSVNATQIDAFHQYRQDSKPSGHKRPPYGLVFQKRYNGNLDFYKNWKEYKEGFGDLNKEFWLGNDKLHQITSLSEYTLRVLMEDFDNETRYAQYQSFTIGDAASKYKLSLNSYSGDAGDSLTYSNNMQFTTHDQENHEATSYVNCDVNFHGAWWYRNCHHSNLSGGYLAGEHQSYGVGMNWYTWRGWHYSYKSTRMMIRRQ